MYAASFLFRMTTEYTEHTEKTRNDHRCREPLKIDLIRLEKRNG